MDSERFLIIPGMNGSGATGVFSTRRGGFSPPPYDSLNLSYSSGDDRANVERNAEVFWRDTGLDRAGRVHPRQVHSDVVALVDRRDAGTCVPAADALVTAEPGLPLLAHFADCTPIYLVDPATRSAGLAHSGWKGTVKRIGARVVEKMVSAFNSSPKDLIAVVGPSIGPCCYEVGEDVADAAGRAFGGRPDVLEKSGIFKKSGLLNGRLKWKFDMWEANRLILTEAGVDPSHITVMKMCTCCRRDLFFSYRRDGPKSGRMAAVLALR